MDAKDECEQYFASVLVAGGISQNYALKLAAESPEDGADQEPFPFSVEEVSKLLKDADYPRLLNVAKTVHACRRVADEFYYGMLGPKGMSAGVRERMDYLDGIFNSMMGWKKEQLQKWLEKIASGDEPDGTSVAGHPIYFCKMEKPSEIEAFIRRGRGIFECWYCEQAQQTKVRGLCSRCREARYCSVECQRKHFSLHRRYCTPRSTSDLRLQP